MNLMFPHVCLVLQIFLIQPNHQAQGRLTCGCHRGCWARWWLRVNRATWCAGTTPTAPGRCSPVRWRCCFMLFQLQVRKVEQSNARGVSKHYTTHCGSYLPVVIFLQIIFSVAFCVPLFISVGVVNVISHNVSGDSENVEYWCILTRAVIQR